MNTEIISSTITAITTLGATVAAEHNAHVAALSAECDAEAKLLDATIAAVRPALAALAGRIKTYSYRTMGQNGLNPVRQSRYATERGYLVADGFDQEGDTTGNRGKFCGSQVYLLRDGTWLQLRRTGHWSCWQGEADTWEATSRVLSSREVAEFYDAEQLIANIATGLKQQAEGNKSARTKAAEARAMKLGALAALLAG